MAEIIYPSIIIVSLSVIFFLFWRKAYQVETNQISIEKRPVLDEDSSQDTGLPEQFGDFWSTPESVEESDDEKDEAAARKPGAKLSPEISQLREKADDLFKKGQYISAEKWYIEAARETPKDAGIYSRLGIIYLQQKNFIDAEEAIKEAVKIDDKVASRFFNLSYACWCQSKFHDAINYAKRACRLDVRNSKYRAWLEKLRLEGF